MDTYITISTSEFENLVSNFTANIHEIDVRPLEMPMPMITIMNELRTLKQSNALLVTHHKVPQILLNDLSEENLKIYLTQPDANLVKLFFIKV
jgi:uncharacterized protein (DUF2249 family)